MWGVILLGKAHGGMGYDAGPNLLFCGGHHPDSKKGWDGRYE